MTDAGSPAAARPLRLAYLADPNSVHTRRWLTFFADRGHEVHLLVGTEDEVRPGLAEQIHVHRYRRFGPRRVPFVSSLQGRTGLRRLLAGLRPDLLHAHFLSRYGWQARLSGFHPYAVTVWGSDVLVAPRSSRRARLWGRATLRGADLVTAAGSHLAEAAIGLGAVPTRVLRGGFGVDTTVFRPEAADAHVLAGLGLTGHRILFAPRALRPIYRHEVLLRAAAELPSDLVILAGAHNADAAYLAELRSLARDLGLEQRFVVAEGFDPGALPTLYATAAAVVSVPDSDGIPLSVLEGMASGSPVLVTDLPGPRACVGDEPDLLVAPGDVQGVSVAIRRLLDLAPPQRQALGTRLRNRVREQYEWQDQMQAIEDAYRDLAPGPAVPR